MIWKLALRHLFRQWRINLILLIIMILGASLLASLPILAITIAGENLSQTLHNAPAHVRNMVIQGKSKSDELPEGIELTLEALLVETMAVRESDLQGFTIIFRQDGTQLNLYPATLILNLRSFDRLEERVRVLDGRLPVPDPVAEKNDGSPIYEVAIGQEAARRSGFKLGDEFSPLGGRYHLRIVGIVEPLNPDAEYWWGDRQMQPFSFWRRIYISPDIDEWNVSLIVHPETMISKIYHNQYWRVILRQDEISASNAPSVRQTLVELQSKLSDDGFLLKTDLIDLISRFEQALALAQVSLLLLTFQSLFVVFYLLGMFGNFLVEQSRSELATLSGRGFSRGQITGIFARATGLLAFVAISISPLMAHWLLVLWSNWRGRVAPSLIPAESWWLALATGLFCWLFLVISIYRAARYISLAGQRQGLTYDKRAKSQRHLVWDIFILTLGGLAYWQLTQGSTITNAVEVSNAETAVGISDLVLLLGPSLLLLAVALIIIRILPFLWRFLARISQESQGLTWNLVFTRLSRQPVGPSQVTLLISLTAGLTFFASAFTFSIETWQQDLARYTVGTDIRIRQPSIDPTQEIIFTKSRGVTGVAQVIRGRVPFLVNEYQRLDFDLLAVNPDTFSSVVSYPAGISSFSIDQIMSVLEVDSPEVLPIIISSNANTRHLDIGDQITLELGGETYLFEIVGIIINFPLLNQVFAITDLASFAQKVDLQSMSLTDQGSREIWLAVDPNYHDMVIAGLEDAGLEDLIVGDSRQQFTAFQNNLVFREVTTAFGLNALILIPLSVIGFFLIQLFSAQRRVDEFDVLHAMGFSEIHIRGLLIREGLIFISLGLLIGIGIGFGLALMMEPFLSQILPPLRGNFVLNQILVDWFQVGFRFIILVGFYGIGLLLLIVSAFRNQDSVQI